MRTERENAGRSVWRWTKLGQGAPLVFVIRLHYNGFRQEGANTVGATALVQTRIDPAVRDRAAEVLDGMGLTVSDAVRILLTRVANEGALPAGLTANPEAHDAWFRAKVVEALQDQRPPIALEEAERHFAGRRVAALAKVARQPK